MLEAEQAGHRLMIIIIVVYAFFITDMTRNITRQKCQQCFQVNIFMIRAMLSIHIDDRVQYLCIKNDARILIQSAGRLRGGAEVNLCQMRRGCWRAEQGNSPFCLLGLNRKMMSF
jgi:hypothetical protein